jgi:hypothetical protein
LTVDGLEVSSTPYGKLHAIAMPIGIEVEIQPNNTSDSRSSASGMTPPEEATQDPPVEVLNYKRGREATPA